MHRLLLAMEDGDSDMLNEALCHKSNMGYVSGSSVKYARGLVHMCTQVLGHDGGARRKVPINVGHKRDASSEAVPGSELHVVSKGNNLRNCPDAPSPGPHSCTSP